MARKQVQKVASTKKHKKHIMKLVSTRIEELAVYSSSITQNQKRAVTKYICACQEEEVFYRQPDHPALIMKEYIKLSK